MKSRRQATPTTYIKPACPIWLTNGQKGYVLKTITKKDQFGMPINVFRVTITHKLVGRSYKEVTPAIENVNYSFVTY